MEVEKSAQIGGSPTGVQQSGEQLASAATAEFTPAPMVGLKRQLTDGAEEAPDAVAAQEYADDASAAGDDGEAGAADLQHADKPFPPELRALLQGIKNKRMRTQIIKKFKTEGIVEDPRPGKRARVELQQQTSGSDQPAGIQDSTAQSAGKAAWATLKAKVTAKPANESRTFSAEPTCTLRVDNLQRPFTLNALQSFLASKGTLASQAPGNASSPGGASSASAPFAPVWIDTIKTHCYATFASVDEAKKVCAALEGQKFPVSNDKTLKIEYSFESAPEVAAWQSTEDARLKAARDTQQAKKDAENKEREEKKKAREAEIAAKQAEKLSKKQQQSSAEAGGAPSSASADAGKSAGAAAASAADGAMFKPSSPVQALPPMQIVIVRRGAASGPAAAAANDGAADAAESSPPEQLQQVAPAQPQYRMQNTKTRPVLQYARNPDSKAVEARKASVAADRAAHREHLKALKAAGQLHTATQGTASSAGGAGGDAAGGAFTSGAAGAGPSSSSAYDDRRDDDRRGRSYDNQYAARPAGSSSNSGYDRDEAAGAGWGGGGGDNDRYRDGAHARPRDDDYPARGSGGYASARDARAPLLPSPPVAAAGSGDYGYGYRRDDDQQRYRDGDGGYARGRGYDNGDARYGSYGAGGGAPRSGYGYDDRAAPPPRSTGYDDRGRGGYEGERRHDVDGRGYARAGGQSGYRSRTPPIAAAPSPSFAPAASAAPAPAGAPLRFDTHGRPIYEESINGGAVPPANVAVPAAADAGGVAPYAPLPSAGAGPYNDDRDRYGYGGGASGGGHRDDQPRAAPAAAHYDDRYDDRSRGGYQPPSSRDYDDRRGYGDYDRGGYGSSSYPPAASGGGGAPPMRTSGACFECGEVGHVAKICPRRGGRRYAAPPPAASSSYDQYGYGGGGGGGNARGDYDTGTGLPTCHICRQPGHYARECTSAGTSRRTPGACYNCGEPGHMSRDCPRLR